MDGRQRQIQYQNTKKKKKLREKLTVKILRFIISAQDTAAEHR